MIINNGWTRKENTELRRLFGLGLSDTEISNRMPGRTANAVRIQRSAIGAVKYTKTKGYTRKQNKPYSRGPAKLPTGTQVDLFNVPPVKKVSPAQKKKDEIVNRGFTDSVQPPASIDYLHTGTLTITVSPQDVIITGNVPKSVAIRFMSLIISKIVE